jgi:hypothetical protein
VPKDGSLVELYESSDLPPIHAFWRITRIRDAERRRWVPTGFWADPVTRKALDVEPIGFRRPEGFASPDAIR